MDDSQLTSMLSMIGKLISQPDNIRMILSLLGDKGSREEGETTAEPVSALPDIEAVSAEASLPLPEPSFVPSEEAQAVLARPIANKPHPRCKDMLCSIKPYMNGHRKEMIDRIIKVSDLVEIFRGLERT